MSSAVNVFPNFADGDVKIILSEDPKDTLMLHTTTLAAASPFFKASLERIEWSHNKSSKSDNGERQVKLLELDFEDSDTFPLLIGLTTESTTEKRAAKRKQYDSVLPSLASLPCLTPTRYSSDNVVSAYKNGFVLMYGMRIDTGAIDVQELATTIPAFADFADVYGLLPAYCEQVNGLIFGYKWDGYDIIAANPFHMLRVACKIESEPIFKEAMKHAVGIHHRLVADSVKWGYSKTFFIDVGELDLQAAFDRHNHDFAQEVITLRDDLFSAECYNDDNLGLAKHIGLAIYRDWVVKNIATTDCMHGAVATIRDKGYDITDMIAEWSTDDWQEKVRVSSGHNYQAIQNAFKEAENVVCRVFNRADNAKGSKADHVLRHPRLWKGGYIACPDFDGAKKAYEYPWTVKSKIRAYVP